MKLTGCMFPPAGALAALYVDNAKMQTELGIFHCLMPGLSGTAVLTILAALKIIWFKRFGTPGAAVEKLVKHYSAKDSKKDDPSRATSGEERGRTNEKNSS